MNETLTTAQLDRSTSTGTSSTGRPATQVMVTGTTLAPDDSSRRAPR